MRKKRARARKDAERNAGYGKMEQKTGLKRRKNG